MKKRITALLLALTMLGTSGLIACSDTPDDTPADTTTAASVETTTAEIPPEYVSPGSDYDGKDFTIASFDYNTSSWKAALYCEAYVEETNGDIINDSVFERNAAVEDEFDINIKLFPLSSLSNGSKELSVPILAGDHVTDIALMNGSGLPTMFGVKGEYLIDLYDLEGVDFSHSWWDQKSVEEFTILGRMYAATGDISLWSRFAPIAYFFNKQVAEDNNIEDLYALVRSGGWTMDKLVEMCTVVSRDVDGDGTMTEKDAYGMCHQLNLILDMMLSFDIRMTEKNKDGISELVLNNDRTATAVEKIVPFLNNDQITVSTAKFTGYNNVFKDLHLNMFMDNRILFNMQQLLITMDLRDMEADFGIIPPPKMDENQEDYVAINSAWWATFLIVPITNPNLKMTGEVVESLGYHGQQIVTPAYIDVSVTGRELRDADSEEMLNLVLDSLTYDLAQFFNWGGINGIIQQRSTKNDPNFASAWAANESKIQAAIDATFSGWEE